MLFSTRRGGVSEGPFASLNLGLLTDDAPRQRRREPRAALADAVGAPARALPLRPPGPRGDRAPRHRAARARSGRTRRRGRAGDRARATRRRSSSSPTACRSCSSPTARWPRCTAAGAGWRRDRRPRACAALREVGGEGADRRPRSARRPAAAATRSARRSTRASPRYDARVGERNLDLAAVARAQLAGAGVDEVHDVGLCTMCWSGCSSPTAATAASPAARRGSCGAPDHRRRRRPACARTRARRARSRGGRARPAATPARSSSSPPSSTSPLEELGVLAEAGLTLLGENRAQDLEAKATAASRTFRWHFIGQLQSRKVKQILPYVGADPLGRVRLGAAASSRRTARPRPRSSSRSTSPARRARPGSRPDELRRFLERAPVRVVGLMTMPPFAEDPEASRPALRARCESSPARTACTSCRWARRRTTRSPSRRARRSCGSARRSTT